MIDIDKTLINPTYDFTVPVEEIKSTVLQAQNCGLIIGLNSDSAIPTIAAKSDCLGITGPIIAERGALFLPTSVAPPIVVNPAADNFVSFRDAFLAALLKRSVGTGHDLVIIGDVNFLVNQLPAGPAAITTAKRAIIINGLRRCSCGLWVRTRDTNGQWQIDEPTLRDVFEELLPIGTAIFHDGAGQPIMDVDYNPEYGIIIIHHPLSSKAAAIHQLRVTYPDRTIYMIGDSMSDWMGGEQVIQCAVGNASADYRRRCQLVSSDSFTAGVLGILETILGA
ncbi:MAG: hypothetical protein AAB817_01455 [Patescibacteria group bacterium]